MAGVTQKIADKEALKHAMNTARAKLVKIEQKEKYTEGLKLLGKCYKTRNNYSCPEKASDYWWLYVRVTKVDIDGSIYAFEFQIDNGGKIDIRPNQYFFHPKTIGGYQQITLLEFKKAMKALELRTAKQCRIARRNIPSRDRATDDKA